MRKLVSLLGLVLILAGVALIVNSVYSTKAVEGVVEDSNNRAVDCYLNGCESGEENYSESEGEKLLESVGGLPIADYSEESENLDSESEPELSQLPITEDMIGVFYADDIDLVEPLYRGANFNNLARGVATVDYENDFDDQNVNIAGHRVEGPDIRFNNIGELEVDDSVHIGVINDEGDEELTEYKITDKYLVDQYAVDEMEQNPGESQELTLITCDGYNPETNVWEERLIIKAEIVD